MTADILTVAKKRKTQRIPSAKQLRELRDRLGLTQEEMGERFGVVRRVYQNWELGISTPPGPVAILYEIFLPEIQN